MRFLKALIKSGLWLTLLSFVGGSILFTSVYLYLSPKLPSVEVLKQVKLQTPLRIYSQDNKLIGEFGEKRRNPIQYEEVPPLFIKAIYAAEDDRFMSHHGVDPKGLLRATSQLLKTGHIQTGGSTITMQVARNFFLSRKKNFLRKFNEILLALQIERELTKQEILSLYINYIYLGKRAYGFEAASNVYYGKSIQDLNLAQLAMLAVLPKAPSSINPIANPSRALVRRNWILGRMLKLEYIDQTTFDRYISEPITAKYHGQSLELYAPYIAEMARKEAVSKYGKSAYTDGYKVITTVESNLQERAQLSVQKGIRKYDQRHGYRGPENHIESFLVPGEPLGATSLGIENDGLSEEGRKELFEQIVATNSKAWLKALKNIPTYADQYPAVVADVLGKSIQAQLASGEIVEISWKHGLEKARPFLTVDSMGANPKSADSFLTIGDVIRVIELSPGEWHLTQIPTAQAALVALSPTNGGIKALVGGYDFLQSKFNRATQAERQPGSNFKPFIYSAALENGFTAATLINDAPVVFDDNKLESTWRPENSSGKFFGPTRLRTALTKSRNLVSIRLLRKLGVGKARSYASRFGFDTSKLPKDLSLALGSHAVAPIEIANGYAILANGGHKISPFLVDRILDVNNKVIFKAKPFTVCSSCKEEEKFLPQPEDSLEEPIPVAPAVMDKRVAFIINSILKDVIKHGTGRRALSLKRDDIAGKTGTTNGPKDAWFSGFNGDIAATTWVGFDQNLNLGNREYGGSAALPIWIDFMKLALDSTEENALGQPDGIITVKIDPKTGKRATPNQLNAQFEIFRSEYAPIETVDIQTPSAENEPNQEESLPEDLF